MEIDGIQTISRIYPHKINCQLLGFYRTESTTCELTRSLSYNSMVMGKAKYMSCLTI